MQAPGLFDGCEFYFSGSFVPPRASKEDLLLIVQLSGGNVLHREPLFSDQELEGSAYPFHAKPNVPFSKFIVYDPCRRKLPPKSTAKNIAVVPVSWLLDCLKYLTYQTSTCNRVIISRFYVLQCHGIIGINPSHTDKLNGTMNNI